MTDPISNLPVSQQIAMMRRRLLDDPTPIDPIDMARWLRSLCEKHWSELGRARISAMSMRHGENVVNLETINRKFQGDRPCDVN